MLVILMHFSSLGLMGRIHFAKNYALEGQSTGLSDRPVKPGGLIIQRNSISGCPVIAFSVRLG
jgi:hypothetical protein